MYRFSYFGSKAPVEKGDDLKNNAEEKKAEVSNACKLYLLSVSVIYIYLVGFRVYFHGFSI